MSFKFFAGYNALLLCGLRTSIFDVLQITVNRRQVWKFSGGDACRLGQRQRWMATSSSVDDKTSTVGVRKDGLKKKKPSVHPFKRINWENANLFGPLLRRSTADDVKRTWTYFSNNFETTNKKVTGRVVENGFKNIDGPPIVGNSDAHEMIKVRRRSENIGRSARLTEQYAATDDRPVEELGLQNYNSSIRHDDLSKSTIINTTLDDDRPALSELLQNYPLSGDYCRTSSSNDIDDWLSKNWLPDRTKPNTWPSVTSILQATMSAESLAVLEAWKSRMIAKLGVQGFEKYKRELFSVGKDLHRCIEEYLSSEKGLADIRVADDTESTLAGHWRSLCAVLPHVSEVRLLETRVQHPRLCYTGVVDCVAKYRGSIVLIEWKTSQRPKVTLAETYDNPLQAIAYLGALRAGLNDDDIKMDGALVVVASAGGSPAHVHFINEELCQHYWSQWLERLCKYYNNSPSTISM